MGNKAPVQQSKTQQSSSDANDQYLSLYQLQRLTPRLVKSLGFKRPYQNQLKQHRKKIKKMKLQQGLYQGLINQNQKPFGLGKIYHENGSLIVGKFEDGKLTGHYHTFHIDGSYFCGYFTANNHKRGHFCYPDGTLQEGHFTDDLLQGFGSQKTLKYTLQGQFSKGKPVEGTLRWYKENETHIYEGSFDENGNFTGEGKLIEPLGTYSGQFKNGLKHGKGIYKFKNGLVYQGQYSNGIKQGQGVLYNSDGSICYVGHFAQNVPNGKGASVNKKGRKVQTQYFQGLSKRQLAMVQSITTIDNGEN